MTVGELIQILQTIPDKELTVFREGGEYRDDWRRVEKIIRADTTTLAQKGVYIR